MIAATFRHGNVQLLLSLHNFFVAFDTCGPVLGLFLDIAVGPSALFRACIFRLAAFSGHFAFGCEV